VFPYAGGEKGCKCHDGNWHLPLQMWD
jgi:hypothetical protein